MRRSLQKETFNKIEFELAPVALFAFNRPNHLTRTLKALANNTLALNSDLHVFIDGPKSPVDQVKVMEVERVVAEIEGFNRKRLIKREKNLGLAESIVCGINEILEEHETVIVLEDDIVTSTRFLEFMNLSLNHFKDEDKVMHISGYWFPVRSRFSLPDFFFNQSATCWGWATWKRAWKHFSPNPRKLKKEIFAQGLEREFTFNGNSDFEYQLDMNIDGVRNTWAVKWYASMLLNGGLALHPSKSYTNNIGNDGSGENSRPVPFFNWEHLNESVPSSFPSPNISRIANNAYSDFFNRHFRKISPYRKVRNYLGKIYHEFIDSEELKRNKQLLSGPRFVNATYEIEGHGEFTYVDNKSFWFMYDEIFNKKIYQFRSETDTPLIIDCGANVGLSILFFKKIFPKCRIIGFEPDPEIFQVLCENVGEFSDVDLINKGLWSERGSISFFSDSSDGGKVSEVGNTKVDVTLLSDYLQNDIDFLKMDIEGAEFQVLVEAGENLKNVRNIFVEYHSFKDENQTLPELMVILKEAGFRIYVSAPGFNNPRPFSAINVYKGMDQQLNIFGIR